MHKILNHQAVRMAYLPGGVKRFGGEGKKLLFRKKEAKNFY
jgi:hypothetical protein